MKYHYSSVCHSKMPVTILFDLLSSPVSSWNYLIAVMNRRKCSIQKWNHWKMYCQCDFGALCQSLKISKTMLSLGSTNIGFSALHRTEPLPSKGAKHLRPTKGRNILLWRIPITRKFAQNAGILNRSLIHYFSRQIFRQICSESAQKAHEVVYAP